MLELHTTNIPTDSDYRNLLPFLLQPAVWHQQSRIPGQGCVGHETSAGCCAGHSSTSLRVFSMAITVDGLTPGYPIGTVKEIQSQSMTWAML